MSRGDKIRAGVVQRRWSNERLVTWLPCTDTAIGDRQSLVAAGIMCVILRRRSLHGFDGRVADPDFFGVIVDWMKIYL